MHRFWIVPLMMTLAVNAWGQGQIKPANSHVNMYFPQLADGGPVAGRWQTAFTFVNSSSLTARIELRLYDNAGKPMTIDFGNGAFSTHIIRVPGFGSKLLSSRMGSETLKVGWAVAYADTSVLASASFRLWAGEKALQEVTSPPSAQTRFYDSYANKELGVAIANPSTSKPITLEVVVLDSLGLPGGPVATVTLPPLGHTSFNVKDKFSFVDQGDWSLYIMPPTLPGDSFVAWTMNADGSGTFSSLPSGAYGRPASHRDRIEQIYSRLMEVGTLLEMFKGTPQLSVTTGEEVNAFVENGANVTVSLGLAQVMSESDNELAFVLAHQFGHIFQQQNSNFLLWDDDPEKDANMWAIYFTFFAGYDPYAMPGALGHLVMATGPAALTSVWEKSVRTVAHVSLKAQLDDSWATLNGFCNISPEAGLLCSDYRKLFRPNVPKGGAITSSVPAIRHPAGLKFDKATIDRLSRIRREKQ